MSSSSVNDELTNLNSVANKIHAGRYGNTSEKAILQQMIAMGNIDKMIDLPWKDSSKKCMPELIHKFRHALFRGVFPGNLSFCRYFP